MRTFSLLAAVSVLVLAVGSAAAKTVTVTITKNGYVPSSTSVAQGDTVQFTNSDTIVHQVAFKSTTGVVCTPSPLVIQPTASGSCTFNIAGSYTYSDPNVKGHVFRGTVTVTASPASLSIAVNTPIVVYGGSAMLSGTLSTQKVGDKGADDNRRRVLGGREPAEEHCLYREVQRCRECCRHGAGPAESPARQDRGPSFFAAGFRGLEPRRQVRKLPALQRNAQALGRRAHRAPEGIVGGHRADCRLGRVVSLVDPVGPASPRHVGAGASRRLLRARDEQHDFELSSE